MNLGILSAVLVTVLYGFSAVGQTGTLTFSTLGGVSGDGLVFDIGGTPLGSTFLGEIYTSPTITGPFVPVGGAQVFSDANPGAINAGTTVTSPNVSAGAFGYYEIRVWNFSAGATYEVAQLVPGAHTGSSCPMLANGPFGGMTSGDSTTVGPLVNNFENFRITLELDPPVCPEPSALALVFAGSAGFLALLRRR